MPIYEYACDPCRAHLQDAPRDQRAGAGALPQVQRAAAQSDVGAQPEHQEPFQPDRGQVREPVGSATRSPRRRSCRRSTRPSGFRQRSSTVRGTRSLTAVRGAAVQLGRRALFLLAASASLPSDWSRLAGNDTPSILQRSPQEIFTTAEAGPNAFSIPVAMLDNEQAEVFAKGKEQFNEAWVVAPEPGGVWGLGPTFNEDRCAHCHANNGRAAAPENGTGRGRRCAGAPEHSGADQGRRALSASRLRGPAAEPRHPRSRPRRGSGGRSPTLRAK